MEEYDDTKITGVDIVVIMMLIALLAGVLYVIKHDLPTRAACEKVGFWDVQKELCMDENGKYIKVPVG